MDLLVLDVRRPASSFGTVEPPYRLYGCQSNVMYSRPQSFDGKNSLLINLLHVALLNNYPGFY